MFLLSCSGQNEPIRPNIILISVDDMGWSDLGCYGGEISTPNIDKLAINGMRFRSFYNAGKCFPSRAALLTGVYAQDCGYDKTHTNPIRNAVTLGEVLQDAGYATYFSGKHHGIDNPYNRGFQRFYGLIDGAFNHFNPGKQREGEPKPAQKRNDRQWGIDSTIFKPYTPKERDFYSTDYFTNYALDYMEESKMKNEPFFLYLSYTAPHDPLMAWPEDIAKYKGKYDLGYGYIRQQRFEKQKSLGLLDNMITLPEPTHKNWDSLSPIEQEYEASVMEVYAAMVDRIDQNIGRLLAKLDKIGAAENTIILFVSDNGASAEIVDLENDDNSAPLGAMARWTSLRKDWANVANTPFRLYKNHNYEGGINSPLIAYWPNKIKPNTFTNYPGHFIDFMSTFLELSGASYPDVYNGEKITPLRGKSLVAVFKNPDMDREGPLFWEWRGSQAVRLNNWKIVRNGKNSQWDLYNMTNDPTEIQNLAEEKKEKVLELDRIYTEWIIKYR
ncbi:arylsulfatase [Arenibacter sp. H213]|uniref:Arylsulfatase n=1 Tax=Arenibacter antarcticus TaxID=2040469 RepID=A0ABW5VEE5_9FLAO|nr:arylsulfatase [Arenibacter sp. H213]